MWYMAQKVKKYALNSKIQALHILTNDDEVENGSLSSFLLAVMIYKSKTWIGFLNTDLDSNFELEF